MNHRILGLGSFLVMGLIAPGARAEVQTSSTGGSIVGLVRYEGTPPPAATIHAHVNAEICGASTPMLREDLVVSKEGGLSGVALFLDASEALGSHVTPKRGRLDQKNCTFVPHVQTVTVGSKLVIGNSDRIIHNVHATNRGRTVFNLAMPRRGIELERNLEGTGIIQAQCDSGHNWMSAYIIVVPHDFHASSDRDGRFRIDGIPPGEHHIRAWHEVLGMREGTVTVEVGQVARIELDYTRAAELTGSEEANDAEMQKKLEDIERAMSSELEAAKSALEELQSTLASERRKSSSAQARPLFLQHCATCHGRNGDGQGPSRKHLSIMARDFTRGEYKFRMTPSGAPPRVEDVYRTISVGVAGTEMPPWRDFLTPRQRLLLAQYVLSFAEFDEAERQDPISIGEPPEPTDESVARGKEVFDEMQCAQCHGPQGRGDGPSLATLKDVWGNPIRPADLTQKMVKGGEGPRVLYRTIVTGLSGSPMPSFGDLLEEDDRWALVHYLMSLSRGRGAIDYLFGDPAGRMTVP